MGYLDELKLKVAALEQTNDIKEAEIALLIGEREDTLKPSAAMFEMATIIMGMLADNAKFVKKNGMTAKAKESRESLLRLMDIRNNFAGITDTNNSFKAINRNLHTDNMLLRVENADLKKQLETYHATTKDL